MFWLKGVKILYAIASVFIGGFLFTLSNHELGWAALYGLLALLFAGVARCRVRQLYEHEEPYKNVRFLCVNESPTVWSTHIGGIVERPATQLYRRIKELALRKSGSLTGMKLVLQPDDRLAVRRCSLNSFINKLEALNDVKGAVLLTASVLNETNRGGGRLQERIKAIDERPQWRYQLIERRVGVFGALVGRVFYGWKLPKAGGFWNPYVPGLIAWRESDHMPDLNKLKARYPEIYEFDSLKRTG